MELAEELNSPGEILEAARELTPDYITTRYVNAATGIPAKIYSQHQAKLHLNYAREVMNWMKQQ